MGSKIFIVDDDSEISSLVKGELEAAGHEVQVCDNGREVMNLLHSYKPDLLLLDVMLPGIDGYSLASQITEDADTKAMPIIVLSALEPSRAMFQKFSQVTAYLTKPFNTEDLMSAVENALAKKT